MSIRKSIPIHSSEGVYVLAKINSESAHPTRLSDFDNTVLLNKLEAGEVTMELLSIYPIHLQKEDTHLIRVVEDHKPSFYYAIVPQADINSLKQIYQKVEKQDPFEGWQ